MTLAQRSIEAADALANTPETTALTSARQMQAGLLRSCSQGSTGKSLALAHTCTPAVLPEVGLVLELHAQVSPCISSVLQSLYGQLSTRRGECCGCAGAVRGLDRAHIRARNGPHPPCLRPADALCGCRSLPPLPAAAAAPPATTPNRR